MQGNSQTWKVFAGVACILLVISIQMVLTANRNSITWDEDNHLYAGFMSWKTGDFGINPEHPPLVKLVSALPLLNMHLRVPVTQDRFFKTEGFLGGKDFLFKNDADTMLFRARMASSLFTLLLALAVFFSTRKLFGTGAAFIAIALLALDPNIIAHSALVTTDIALSLFLFLSVYAFYRYSKAPSAWKLIAVGLSAGLALGSKHTGILVFPILLLLAIVEIIRPDEDLKVARKRQIIRMVAALVVASSLAIVMLWSFYGFRYAARPAGKMLNPPLSAFVQGLPRPHATKLISSFAQHKLLPESYLYGLADVLSMDGFYRSYVLGKTYPHGVWFYFPVAFAIKSTLTFLILLGISLLAFITRWLTIKKEHLYLIIPPLFYLLVAMSSGMNIGVRHILPLYVFGAVLLGATSWSLLRRNRQWAYILAALIAFQAISSFRTYPAFLAYGNELWGGPSNTYKYLSDSNSDWGQQLKSVRKYLERRGIRDCYFVYFAGGVVDTDYYNIPCKLLPTADSLWVNAEFPAPERITGTILISAGDLSGFEFGPGPLNPYEQFRSIRPTAVIDYSVFVYDGQFEIPGVAALWHAQRAQILMGKKDFAAALDEARKAQSLAPDTVNPNALLGDILMSLQRPAEAKPFYEKAISLAKTVEPEFQAGQIPKLENSLKQAQGSSGQ